MSEPDGPGRTGHGHAGAGAPPQEHREAGHRLEQMLAITDAALGYLSLEEMLSELLERIREGLRADTAAILLLDEDRGVLVAKAARGLEEEVRQGVQVPLAHGFAGRVAAGRRPIVIEDLSRADVVNPILRQRGIRSMLGVPIHIEGRVIGVMHVGTLERRLFDGEDTALLQLAADRAAMAIDRARATEQRSVTEIMQRALLPDKLPALPGVRFSAKYLPGGAGVKLGGDWYDVFQLPSGRLGFVIGDVVGRGVAAAAVMAEIRASLRAYLTEGHPLPEVMQLLNELLVSIGRHRSATVAIVELDFEHGSLDAVSAGHLPPLVVAPDGEASFLEPVQGLPLGVRRGSDYRSRRHRFEVGSVLVLYTDGLVERRGEPIDEGLDRLRAAARRAARHEDASFADRVYRELVEDGGALEDDVALLAIESLPLGSEIEMTIEADPGVLAGLRRTLGRWLMSEAVEEEQAFSITLAASEAAANAIEHAYGAQESTFRVSGVHEGGEVRVVISDEGRWRASRPHGRGRGLAIMRALVDDARIERRSDGTSVTLVKCVGPGPG